MTDHVIVSRLTVEVLTPNVESAVETEKLLAGSITCPVSVTGRLSSVAGFHGSISTGKTRVNGRLSVTHDWGLFNV